MFRLRLLLFVGLSAAVLSQDINAQSFYPVRLEDKAAVYLSNSADHFGAKGDGVADDTAALQKAIDTVADTTHQGIVFIPEGHYRLTHTLYVWPGVRLIVSVRGTTRLTFTDGFRPRRRV
jgi:polygalacturonase